MIFQSTLPREERQEGSDGRSEPTDISIHAPTRGATRYVREYKGSLSISIHAPTRGATIRLFFLMDENASISIHAPTRGATNRKMVVFDQTDYISIHAPTRGATVNGVTVATVESGFQSTLPREERQRPRVFVAADGSISIHAPTRGATLYHCKRRYLVEFQSTLPREERPT